MYLLAIDKGKFGPLCTFTLRFPQDFIILFSKVIVWPFQKVAQTSGENFPQDFIILFGKGIEWPF